MRVIRETCVAGKTIDRVVKVPSGHHRDPRAPKLNLTREAVQRNNDRNATRHLMRLLNANFGYGDFHIVLTYRDLPSKEEAKADRKKFIRQLRAEMKKHGIELKYIAVTEYDHKRIHHHMVVNCPDLRLISEIWQKGFVKSTILDDSGNYIELAEYLIKETQKTFRESNGLYKRRYAASNNLVRPIVKREEVDVKELFEDPEPIKGYYIPKDYERRYQHPVTGLEHLEYIMVALDEPRKYKAWPRGIQVSDREYYRIIEEEQQGLWEELCL